MSFLLPAGLTAEQGRALQRCSLGGGQEAMPFPTTVEVAPSRLVVRRDVDESGFLAAPWPVKGVGQLMVNTATLIERGEPYRLLLELARGKVNQIRNHASDWSAGGLLVPGDLTEELRQVSRAFDRAVVEAAHAASPSAARKEGSKTGGDAESEQALEHAFQAGERLARVYMDQVFRMRHDRQDRLDTGLGCRLSTMPSPPQAEVLRAAFNSVSLLFPWNEIEPEESDYRWETADALVDWSLAQGFLVSAGPLVDLCGHGMPDWLWRRARDLGAVAGCLCDFVETVIERYRSRIRVWHLSASSNLAPVLRACDEELVWLALRLVEAARNVDPTLELIVGIAQPWGDYLATRPHTHSPFVFADDIIRRVPGLHALELEFLLGLTPRGSYCRDLLDASRVLDLYALLGAPLQLALGYPSASGIDVEADPGLEAGAGHWRHGLDLDSQAAWAAAFGELAVCKPYARAVHWTHFTDAAPHLAPHCGLVDAQGNLKPACHSLRQLRDKHLR